MGAYPKINGCAVTKDEYNDVHNSTYLNQQVLETDLEQAYAIAKLQYCRNISDISHDYMIVDVFTDSTGYNNTINATYCTYASTATGFTVSCVSCIITPACCPFSTSFTAYNLGLCATATVTCDANYRCGSAYLQATVCNCVNTFDILNRCAFCYRLRCYALNFNCPNGVSTDVLMDVCSSITGSPDDFNCRLCKCATAMAVWNCSYDVTNCYCFVRDGITCTWVMYCNGLYKCDVNLSTFPTFTFYACSYADTKIVMQWEYHTATALFCMCCICSYYNPGSTSTYVSSALNGNYTNQNFNTFCSCVIANCANNTGFACFCAGTTTYYNCVIYYNAACNSYAWQCTCGQGLFILKDTVCFSFKTCFCLDGLTGIGATSASCIVTTNWQDNKSIVATTSNCCVNCNLLFCYNYIKVSDNCFDFYCNGTCVCQTTLTAPPNIIVCNIVQTSQTGRGCSWFTVLDYCQLLNNKKIVTVPIVWSCPIKMVYYTDENYGTGMRVYNVIDASTGNCIACNLPTNTMCLLACCVCCHRYEIIQCNDAVSCIKSYAIAVGK